MNDAKSATLISHIDTRKISREELAGIPAPEATATHQPVPHINIVESIIESLGLRKLSVVRDEYAVSNDGMKMFGIMEIEENFLENNFIFDGQNETENKQFRFAIGMRNANDKTMRLGLTAGYRVVICDNMAFSGDFEPVFYKHTKRLELSQVIALAVDRIQRNFVPMKKQIDVWRELTITDDDAKLIIYDAFKSAYLKLPLRFLNSVHQHYFEPEEKDFPERTLWSLSNAFTAMVKELPPIKQFQVTAKLGSFLNKQCDQFFGNYGNGNNGNLQLPAQNGNVIPISVGQNIQTEQSVQIEDEIQINDETQIELVEGENTESEDFEIEEVEETKLETPPKAKKSRPSKAKVAVAA